MNENLPYFISDKDGETMDTQVHYQPPKQIDSIKDLPRHEINPFLMNLRINKKPKYKKIQDVEKVSKDKIVVLAEELFRDKEPFVRIFQSGHLVNPAELSPNSCKILLYIMWNKLQFNIDHIILNPKEISNELGMNNMNTIYDCILELVRCGSIAGHIERNIYWVNPQFIYFGNRGTIKLNK